MLILNVYLHVKPEFIDAFLQATVENARHSLQETGVARFDVVQQDDDPSRFALWEVYKTPEALDQHRGSAHYAKWRDAVADMMVEPRSRIQYSNVFPGDEGW